MPHPSFLPDLSRVFTKTLSMQTCAIYVTSVVRETSVVKKTPSTNLPTTISGNYKRTSFVVVTTTVSGDQSTSFSESDGKTAGGLNISDKIALGVGLGVGGATLIVTIMTCLRYYEPLRIAAEERRILPKVLRRREGGLTSPPPTELADLQLHPNQ
ncbi:MAG: hypothetical protein Q9167_005925 [Letrouitia subvulpina]